MTDRPSPTDDMGSAPPPVDGGSPPRLTLVISSLRAGGAERTMALLANHWAGVGRDVTLLTFSAPDEAPFFPVDARVRLVPLALDRPSPNLLVGLVANLRRARTLRRAIATSRPGVVISFMDRTNALVLVATVGLPVPIVVSERSDPSRERVERHWAVLRDLTYRRAARVVALSEASLSYFSAAIRRRGRVIPNPVVPPADRGAPETGDLGPPPTIVAMGRLSREKGFDLLLEAFARLEPARRGWTLEIWGEGPARADLEGLRASLGLADTVRLPGLTTRPGPALARSALFVLSSRHEGFPAVLGEAMALGLPVVAFDCPSGPRELIRHEVDGLLVPADDVVALAAAMKRVLTDDALRARLADRAPEVLDRYSLERVMGLWDGLIGETIAERAA